MTADRDLLATVAEGIGGDPDEPDGAWDVAELAVRDTGRWLAERLRSEGDEAQRRYDAPGAIAHALAPAVCNRKVEFDAAAALILTACGVPEGDDGAAT